MTKLFTVEPPIDLEILDERVPSLGIEKPPCVAMIICHGMGQQVPFETLDAVTAAITEEHLGVGGAAGKIGQRSVEVVLRFVRPRGSEKLLPRAEITLKQDGQDDQSIHLYEAYWAPLTEGAISYTQTAIHLIKAGWAGFKESWANKFNRWMFGEEKNLPIDHDTGRILFITLLIAIPLLAFPIVSGFFVKSIIDDYKTCSCFHAAVNLNTFSWLGFLVLILFASYFIRKFIVQYMGDVIVYVSSNEVNGFWKIRDEIKQIGLTLARVVYGAVDTKCNAISHFLYSKVVVVGHSLGSVVAYDTLNAIINQDQLDKGIRRVVDRTEAFITLGSPLDKIAFLFRQKAKDALTRDVLAAAYQPMILDYKNRPRWWVNVFCGMDVISGSLEYYDDPTSAHSEERRVRNFLDPCKWKWLKPQSTHTDYWKRQPAKSFIYLAATGAMDILGKSALRHNSKEVPIRIV